MRPVRIAWFSTLPGDSDRSSVCADLTAQILPLLSNEFEIELFHDSFESYSAFKTSHYLNAYQRHQSQPFDLCFYQLEDSKDSAFVRSHLGLMPGVVWFHDFLFKNNTPEPIHNSPWRAILSKIRSNHPEWPARKGDFWEPGPYALREGALATLALFSSRRNLYEYQQRVSGKLSKLAPIFLPYATYLADPKKSRSTSSIDQDQLKLGFLGGPDLEYRAYVLLSAISAAQSITQTKIELTWLLERDELSRAEALVGEFNLKNVRFEIGRSLKRWNELLTEMDLAFHLLFSAYGDPKHYLAQSLNAGVPSVVTDFSEAEYLSADIVLKVSAGLNESAELQAIINRAATLKGRKELLELSERSKQYACELYDPNLVAKELSWVLKSNLSKLKQSAQSWTALLPSAKQALLEEVKSLRVAGICQAGELRKEKLNFPDPLAQVIDNLFASNLNSQAQ